MVERLNSFKSVRSLYRRYVLRNAFALFVVLAGGLILFGHALFLFMALWSPGAGALNVWVGLFGFVLAAALIRCLYLWKQTGFRLRTYFHHWEKNHPEVANRASLIVYAHKNPREIDRLGYSKELLFAEDQWVRDYAQDLVARDKPVFPPALVAIFLLLLIPTVGLIGAKYEALGEAYATLKQSLWIRSISQEMPPITMQSQWLGLRGEPLEIAAPLGDARGDAKPFIHIFSSSGWQSFPARVDAGRIVYTMPALYRKAEFYFSHGRRLSNRGQLMPLDPPAIEKGRITLTPPAYTGKPKETLALQPLSVPEGSRVEIRAQATSKLEEARLRMDGADVPLALDGKTMEVMFVPVKSGEFIFSMTDEHGFGGSSIRYPLTLIEDTTPTIEILTPKPVANISDTLVQKVQAHARDDYRIQRIIADTIVNEKEETRGRGLIWQFTEKAARNVGDATELYITYDWDLSQFNMFPGDTLEFTLEAWDNDPLHGPKVGRSQTYVLHYPTLTDLLAQLDEKEEEQLERLNELVDEQKDIGEDAKQAIEKIKEKIETGSAGEEGEEELWFEKQELEKIKERQQQLQKQAKNIEKELENYQEEATQKLTKEEREEQGFTPETLEKMERIRELMNELADRDSQKLIEQIEQTVDQLSKQMETQNLDDLEFSFKDYEQQLDRTLSMLEKTYENRKLEGLRQTADELAQRQDHLQRETDQLAKEKEALEKADGKQPDGEPGEEGEPAGDREQQQAKEELQQKEDLLAERQKRLEEDMKDFLQKMDTLQKSMEEENPMVSENLKRIQEQLQKQGLQNEMRQARQQMQQGQLSQAQQHQQQAQQMLQDTAEQLQQQMQNMGTQNLQQNTLAIRRLMDRCLYLSEKMESLTESRAGRGEETAALQEARIYRREIDRVIDVWDGIAKTNPFMGRDVQRLFRESRERIDYGIEASQGVKWVGLHETRQSLIAINQAVYKMMQDMTAMQQQMQQMSAQQMQQQMQQMISQQQSLSQMLQQLQKMGEKGEKMLQQLQEMAKQQARIRKEIEKMMQKYRHARQMKNQLQGIYEEMREVENMLEEGINDERVNEKQKKILSRMLEAGTFQEKDEFGEEREEDVAKTGQDGDSPDEDIPLRLKDKAQRAADRPAEEKIPYQYREAIKNHFIRLSEKLAE